MTLPSWTRRPRRVAVAAFRRSRRWGRQWIQPILEHVRTRFWLYVRLALIGAAVVGVWSLINFWDWLQIVPDGKESGSTTIRNIGLVIAGLIALPLAIWRSLVAQRQADTAQQSLLNEQYQQGAEMLGSDVLAVRLGGIYALDRLAEEHPERYHIQNMRLLCAFVRHPTGDHGEQGEQPGGETNLIDLDPERDPATLVREDVQAILRAIGDRSEMRRTLEKEAKFRLYLQNANLSGADLSGTDFRRAQLAGAKLRRAVVNNADLSQSNLFKADLSYAELMRTDFSSAAIANSKLVQADLQEANLSGTNLFHADLSCADLRGANLTSTLLFGANLTRVKLQGTDLSDASLRGLEMSGADLSQSILSGTDLQASNLSGAVLREATLCRANLFGVDLSSAILEDADLSGADFSKPRPFSPHLFESDRRPALRLTQEQLDTARADPANPPHLDGAVDAETGKPLVWRGKPLDEEA